MCTTKPHKSGVATIWQHPVNHPPCKNTDLQQHVNVLSFFHVAAPCPNTGIQAKLDCRTNSALISWTPGNGALSFNATLQSFQDAQKHSCFTNGSSCNITSLPCGQHYNVSVTGYGQNCSTCSKPLVTLDTGITSNNNSKRN